jgi:hypothetical protein
MGTWANTPYGKSISIKIVSAAINFNKHFVVTNTGDGKAGTIVGHCSN